LAGRCDAVCFGSLCQRAERSRETILRFVQTARRAVRLFDVNLRQEYFSADIIRRSCELATAVKLNEKELPRVSRLLGLDKGDETGQAAALLRAFPLEAVVLTRGAAGTILYTPQGRVASAPVRYEPHPDADSVGAGDACSAGLLFGFVHQWPAERTVELANHLGAFVASQPGATPTLPDAILEMVRGGTRVSRHGPSEE
jgi:fructokinase